MGYTLCDSFCGFSQDRDSDISHSCFYGRIAGSIFVVQVELGRKYVSLQGIDIILLITFSADATSLRTVSLTATATIHLSGL